MASYNELYRSIIMSPVAVTDRDGVILDDKKVLDELKWEVKLVSDLAYYDMTTENLERLQDFLENVSSIYRNKDVGRKLGFTIPEEYLPDSRKGRSRLHYMFGARVVGELKSWLERTKAVNGESAKYVSKGWERTANANKPHDLLPKINLAYADANYSRINLDGDYLVLEMVIKRKNSPLEAALHRGANSRREKALAILAAQEIAEISHDYGNAVVVVEDLSWINNTMQNGRWNRGELIKRLKEQVELNGGRVFKTSAYNTSQNCHKCGNKVAFKDWHTAICNNCNLVIDRDLNATVNIAMKFVDKGSYAKAIKTRNTSKNKKNNPLKRTANNPGKPLKYPGRDRTKNRPTPKRPRIRKDGETRTHNLCSARNNEDSRVALDQPTVSERELVTVTGSTINSHDYPLLL